MASIPACGQDLPDGPPVAHSQEEIWGSLWQGSPEIFLIVADDAPTAEAAELRARVAESVRAGLTSALAERWGGCGSDDPARWHSGDVRIVVARPSAPDGEALFTPVQSPSLAWVTKTSLEEEVEPVASAAAAALEERLAQPGEVYRPLHAARRALELISGVRQPETEDEAAFFGVLPPGERVWIVMASTRDDEGSAPVDDFFLDAQTEEVLGRSAIVAPFEQHDAGCWPVSSGGTWRLWAWGKTVSANFQVWPCADEWAWDNLISHCCADCVPSCHDRPLAVDEDGRAECRFFIDKPDLGDCDPARGWFDPEGEPQIIEVDGRKVRRCEILQLTGAAREACQNTMECSGCGSGFCATSVPELDYSEYCPDEHYWPLRFVGGALDAPGARLTGTCLTGQLD